MNTSFLLNGKSDLRSLLRILRYVLLTTLLVTFLLVVTGNIVRASGAGQGCPDWPTCFGGWGVPDGLAARIQFVHRGLTLLAGLLITVSAGMATLPLSGRSYRHWIRYPLYGAFGMIIFQSLLGRFLIGTRAEGALNLLHLALALAILGLVALAMLAAFYLAGEPSEGVRTAKPAWRSPFARLSLWTSLAAFALLVSGAMVAATGAAASCSGWPLCSGGLPASGLGWLAFIHRMITVAAAGLVTAQFVSAWRSQRSQPGILTAATAVMLLMIGQVLVSAVMVQKGFAVDLVGLHASSAVAFWVLQVIVMADAGFAARTIAEEHQEALQPLLLKQRARDFFMLNKPLIVALLLVTTYAGMVVGGRGIPSLWLTLWTMLGGALAAGGSSALNQYIDRNLDGEMQRTAKRPLPSHRLMPAEALAYGVGAVLLSFFLMAAFVNLLAALLSLAGMVYYVLLYSIWLKRLTVQNIVIGGGAGAIPPLVGWAAAAGSLNIPSLFLFAIVFLWTPPHFWALALVRRKDYARASIPMLPVVQGEYATRKQIFIYTLELVGLTLLMPVFHITGSLFLISALVLGAWLISAAWRVLRHGGNKLAWKMYRYTSMYLAFLFLALVLDVLL